MLLSASISLKGDKKMTNIDFETIVYNNAISDCVTAYNWICDDLNYYEDKIYHYNEVL